MKLTAISLGVLMALLSLMSHVACEREGPSKPVGTATNKHVEESSARPPKEAADAITGAMKAPLDKAQQAEGVIQGAADVTKQLAEQATP